MDDISQTFSIAAFVLYSKAVSKGLGSHPAGESPQNVTQTFQVRIYSPTPDAPIVLERD